MNGILAEHERKWTANIVDVACGPDIQAKLLIGMSF